MTIIEDSAKLSATLTEQELQACRAEYDLGAGYPYLRLPRRVRRLYSSEEITRISLKMPPKWQGRGQSALDDQMRRALTRFIGLGEDAYCSWACTFSGSIALDRAITAALVVSRLRSSGVVTVVTTSPCLDVMKLLISERRRCQIKFVESRVSEPWGFDKNRLIDEIRRLENRISSAGVVVLLSSPENPTGQVWAADDLRDVSRACLATGAVLLVDHSFLTAGIHRRNDLAAIWEVAESGCHWLAVWDTGKTFGLNEDKLGFIVSGSAELADAVRQSINTLQYGIARRQMLFFAPLLNSAPQWNWAIRLRETCFANWQYLRDATTTEDIGLEAIRPEAGSLSMIRLRGPMTDAMARKQLMAVGVGVVAGRVFFHTSWAPHDLIRIALAREPVYFREGIDRLVGHLGSRR